MNNFNYHIPEIYKNAHLSKIDLPPETLDKIVAWCGQKGNLLLFSGNPGVGKTYLCYSLMNHWLEERRYFRFYEERTFFSDMRKVIQNNWDYEAEAKRVAQVENFILDDLGSGQTTEWQKEVLFSLLDSRINSALPTIFTTNLSLADVKSNYGERFFSRLILSRNTIIELKWIDKRLTIQDYEKDNMVKAND